MRHIISD
jgi:uncharacterized protein YerC